MIEEENLDVQATPEPSAGDSIQKQAVENETEISPEFQQTEVEQEVEEQPSPQSPLGQQSELDEMGVPYKNRFMEAQRKLEKATEQLNAVADRIESNQGQKKQEYSIDELEAFADTTDNDQHRKWAKGEIRRLEKEEVIAEVRQEQTKVQKQQMAEQMKAQSFNEVAKRYPDAFRKDQSGNIVSWNNNSPLAQRIGFHMQDPEIQNNPRGLMVAAALAYSDVASGTIQQAAKQTTQAKAQVKNLQKKTLVEGGGVNSQPQAKTPASQARERLAQTGSIKDGAAAFKGILKERGRIIES